MQISRFMHALCEVPEQTNSRRGYFIVALGLFVFLAGLFYAPATRDWNAYGRADADELTFLHAVPAWSIEYFHQFPLWDPYLRGGSTLIGNPQNPFPISLTFLMSMCVGPVAGVKLGIILNAVLGMAGMYMLLGYFDVIWLARILAALVLSFNGQVAYHLSQGHFMWIMTMYWPWMILFFMKGLKDRVWIYPAALMLSLQFWGAATSPLAFALTILVMLTVIWMVRDRKPGYLLRFAEMMGAFVIFSAPRLLMVMETLYRFPRVIGNEDFQVPWSVFYYAFICRDQLNTHVPGLKVEEYSAYIGIIPCVLAAALFFQWKKFWPFLCVLLFALVMALGNSPYSPFWPVFHMLGGGYFHFSTRSFLMAVFFIAMASGLTLSWIVLHWREKYPAIVLIACLGVFLVMVDFWLVLSPLRKFTVTNARPFEDFQPSIPFSQLEFTEKEQYRFGNSSMMDFLLRNTGIANGYEALPMPSYAHAKNRQGYRGEFYLQEGLGQVEVASWTPNRWDVRPQAVAKDTLIVNQNFDPGWKSDPPRKIRSVNGLLGVDVTPQDSKIVFYYLPFNFILGCWVSFLGLMVMGWDIFNQRKTYVQQAS